MGKAKHKILFHNQKKNPCKNPSAKEILKLQEGESQTLTRGRRARGSGKHVPRGRQEQWA